MKLKNRKLQDHLASPEHSAFAGMIRKRSSGPGRFFLGDCLLSISEILRWLNAFWVYCKVQNCNVPIFLCMCVCVVLDLKIWDNKTLWRRNSFL